MAAIENKMAAMAAILKKKMSPLFFNLKFVLGNFAQKKKNFFLGPKKHFVVWHDSRSVIE